MCIRDRCLSKIVWSLKREEGGLGWCVGGATEEVRLLIRDIGQGIRVMVAVVSWVGIRRQAIEGVGDNREVGHVLPQEISRTIVVRCVGRTTARLFPTTGGGCLIANLDLVDPGETGP